MENNEEVKAILSDIEAFWEKITPNVMEMFDGGSGTDCASSLISELQELRDRIRETYVFEVDSLEYR